MYTIDKFSEEPQNKRKLIIIYEKLFTQISSFARNAKYEEWQIRIHYDLGF